MDIKEVVAALIEAIESPARGSARINALAKAKEFLTEETEEKPESGDSE